MNPAPRASVLAIALASALVGSLSAAQASSMTFPPQSLSVAAPAAPIVVARRGADDPAGDTRRGRGNDDPLFHKRHGADDPAGDTRRGRGKDDPILHKRQGADDPAGDNRRGRGNDNLPGDDRGAA